MPKRERDTTSTDSHIWSRRDFGSRATLIGAGLAIGPLLGTGCSDQPAGVSSSTDVAWARGLNKMKTRQLGTLTISEIGAGAMRCGPWSGQVKRTRTCVSEFSVQG
jgi:hypothetical protein